MDNVWPTPKQVHRSRSYTCGGLETAGNRKEKQQGGERAIQLGGERVRGSQGDSAGEQETASDPSDADLQLILQFRSHIVIRLPLLNANAVSIDNTVFLVR